jgi:hypothetical protein
MKQFINEAKRFQELAGILNENKEELSQFPGGKEYPSFANPLEGFPTEYKELLKKLQRSNDASEMDMLKDKMNVIRKKLKLKPLTKEGIVNEKQPSSLDVTDKKAVLQFLADNGIDDNYFKSMGGRAIENSSDEWFNVLSGLIGKDPYGNDVDVEDDKKISNFLITTDRLGIDFV